ncbi:MAG TPA: hypothetical protein VF627_15750 [Abditibacterium sp.]|jgi:hypothetical protein
MTFWNQIRDAVRMQLEDFGRQIEGFFNVRAQTVMAVLGIVAALILYAYLRTIHGRGDFFGWQGVLLCVVLVLLRFVRRSDSR